MATLTKQQVIERFCKMASEIGSKPPFSERLAHDCFCGQGVIPHDGYQFDEELMEAIELKLARG